MLHGRETEYFTGQVDKKSLVKKIIQSIVNYININTHTTVLVAFLTMLIFMILSPVVFMDKKGPSVISNQVSIEAPVDVEGLLRTSISNVQKHGKLVVTSMDLQSTSSKEISGTFSSTAVTTVSWAKVQYTMDLRKFDPNWISVKGTDILITIPQDYIRAEIVGTNFKDIDNSGWWSSDDEKKKLHDENIKVNEAQMMTQANSLLDVVRPAAAQELKNMFSIPLKAINLKFTIRVNVG